MRKFLSIITLAVLFSFGLSARDYVKDVEKCSSADNLIGTYVIEDEQGTAEVRCFKTKEGTYCFQMVGGKPIYNEDGSMRLDLLNQDIKFRKLPIHKSIIIFGLVYDANKKQWVDGKIHNPFKKIEKANCIVEFVDGGKTLRVFGNLMGIGKSVFWKVKD